MADSLTFYDLLMGVQVFETPQKLPLRARDLKRVLRIQPIHGGRAATEVT